MRKLAMITATFGFIAFAGLAHADEKTENSVKTESGNTITGKHKTTRTKTVERADGSSTETKVETTAPKNNEKHIASDRRTDDNVNVRHDDEMNTRENNNAGVDEKTEHHTTLTGKKQTKSTKKVENGDGSTTETTTTTTEPKKK